MNSIQELDPREKQLQDDVETVSNENVTEADYDADAEETDMPEAPDSDEL